MGLAFAPSFTTFLIGWAVQGAYVIWLPMEVAIVYRRTAGSGRQNLLTRRSAAVLVGALELSVIIGALTSGAIVDTSMTVVLMLPAIVVTVCFFLILFGIERDPGTAGGKFDVIGFCLITDVIGFVMAGLITIRLQGPDSCWRGLIASVSRPWCRSSPTRSDRPTPSSTCACSPARCSGPCS